LAAKGQKRTKLPVGPRARSSTHAGAQAGSARAHEDLQQQLLAWFRAHRRDLPWRRTRDPYAIWVSEIMLQQTQVATVLGYYDRFLARFPDVRALARAGEDEVLHAFQGLGYYSRARRLHHAARVVVERHGGEVPGDPSLLQQLPGLGAYTVGAISSIAFGLREPIVDGNVVRVLTRLFGLRGDPGKSPLKQRLWQLARELVPEREPGDFNQALMELGATRCTPQRPLCLTCPLASLCKARLEGDPESLPELPARAKVTEVASAAAVVTRGDRVLVVRRPSDAPRWGGLWTFPDVELEPGEPGEAAAARAVKERAGLVVRVGALLGRVRHPITRYRITLSAFRCTVVRGALPEGGACAFHRIEDLRDLALPSPHQKLARLLLESEQAS
jgi:A/G-specific adenine glycosylase